jgi:hypothetical protein
MTGRKIPWARVLVEGLVIVASILLAFGIEAWWDGRQARQELSESLVSLREEFLGHRERLIQDRSTNEASRASITMALRMGAADVVALTPDSANILLRNSSTTSLFTPSNSALEALLAANVLERISDLGLRGSVAVERLDVKACDARTMLATVVEDARTREIIALRRFALETNDILLAQLAGHVELVLSQLPSDE